MITAVVTAGEPGTAGLARGMGITFAATGFKAFDGAGLAFPGMAVFRAGFRGLGFATALRLHFSTSSDLHRSSPAFFMARSTSLPKADWALAADCAGNLGEALDKLRLAQKIENSAHVHANIGMMLAKQGKSEEALGELDQAEKLNGRFAIVPFYKGNVFMQLNDYDKAIQAYKRALQLDPKNGAARQSIAMAERQKAQASAIKK